MRRQKLRDHGSSSKTRHGPANAPVTACASGVRASTMTESLKRGENHPRKWVDRSGQPTDRGPTDPSLESHPRKWVDRSGPAYNETPPDSSPESNPLPETERKPVAFRKVSHSLGDGWIFQVQPTSRAAVLCLFLSPFAPRGERGRGKAGTGPPSCVGCARIINPLP